MNTLFQHDKKDTKEFTRLNHKIRSAQIKQDSEKGQVKQLSDNEAKPNTVYYSKEQKALVFKNPDGTTSTL